MTKTTILTTLILSVILVSMPIAAQATVSPTSISETFDMNGGTFTVTKTVTTGSIPANPDIYFLTDTTGSMGGTISSVQNSMSSILSTVQAAEPTAQFAVGEYRDITDAFIYRTTQVMTTNDAAVQTAVNNLSARGGGDFFEANLFALEQVATDPSIGFRPATSSIIVWFGDAPGHNPRGGSTEISATDALVANGMTVIAIDTRNLDQTGQATRISTATGGSYYATIPANAGSVVLDAISALTTDITPSPLCATGLSANFNPTSINDVSGSTSVSFVETITVASGILPGDYTCTIDFLDSAGASLGTQTVTVTIERIHVNIDIKPGSDPSTWNCKNAKGNVPVAVFSTADFDASTIDFATLSMEGITTTETHNQIHLEDKNDDGLIDAVVHLDSKAVCEAAEDIPLKETGFITLIGAMNDGVQFEGTGDIRIVKR